VPRAAGVRAGDVEQPGGDGSVKAKSDDEIVRDRSRRAAVTMLDHVEVARGDASLASGLTQAQAALVAGSSECRGKIGRESVPIGVLQVSPVTAVYHGLAEQPRRLQLHGVPPVSRRESSRLSSLVDIAISRLRVRA